MPTYRVTIEVDLPGDVMAFHQMATGQTTSTLKNVLDHPNWWSALSVERVDTDPREVEK